MGRLGIVAVLVAVLSFAAPTASATSVITGPTFDRSVVAIPGQAAGTASTGEPRLVVLPTGRVLLTAHFQPRSCPGAPANHTGRACTWFSDDGRLFRPLGIGQDSPGDDVDLAVAGNALLQSTMTNPHVDTPLGEATFGTGVLGTTLDRSTDGGRTWHEATNVNTQLINDRPFLLADGKTVLLSYTSFTPPGIQVVRSEDAGATFGGPVVIGPGGIINGAPTMNSTRHEMILPFGASTDSTCVGEAECSDEVFVARSSDRGATWTLDRVAYLPTAGVNSVITAAADGAGRLYVAWSQVDQEAGTDEVYLAGSDRPGQWDVVRVDRRGGGGLLPTVVAGSDGVVGVAYYRAHSDAADRQPTEWSVDFAFTQDGGRLRSWGASNRFLHSDVSHAVAYVGTGAEHAPGGIWDLLGATLDRDCSVHVAWTDQHSHGDVRYARQAGGRRLCAR